MEIGLQIPDDIAEDIRKANGQDIAGRLLIPSAVLRKLQHPHTPAVARTWMAAPPPWLQVSPNP